MEQRLPLPVSVRPWDELPERCRDFFCFTDDYLPLPTDHAAQIGLLAPDDAARLWSWAFSSIPPGWPERSVERFEHEAVLSAHDCWNDATKRAEVRRWLYDRGIPFRRAVYLLYDRNQVVQTTWKMVVRYWDAFAWSVGYAMIAVDHTLRWACCFHHEEVFVFGSRSERIS